MIRFGAMGLCAGAAVLAAQTAFAATLTVNAGGDLQAALNAAKPGDTILLQAGATFTGNFVLPAKNGTAYITIRSSAPDSALPAAGQRMTPSYASQLPKLRGTTGAGSALQTAAGASYWRLLFLEFVRAPTLGVNLVEFGHADGSQNTTASVPHHLVMDRCYLHGDPNGGQRRGLALNSGEAQVLNSYFMDFKTSTDDTQAIAGWTGPGPFLIENNYLEAAGENVIFGGGDPDITNLVPSNITIRRNTIAKRLDWITKSWVIKNLIELKNAQHVLIEGNILENNWAAGQQGYAIVLTPRNQDGTAPWSTVRDITVQNNIIRHVAAGFNICGYDDEQTAQQLRGVVIRNNLMYDISKSYQIPSNPGSGWMAVIGGGPADITIDHNTVDNDGTSIIQFYGGFAPTGKQIPGFVLTNNLLRDNKYGLFGANSTPGTPSLNIYTPNAYVHRNTFAGADPKIYPSDNDFPTLAQWLADFVNLTTADYRLVSSSLSNNAATDGKDIGVDFTELNAAMNTAAPPSDPAPAGGSTPYSGTPVSLPGTVQAENYDVGGKEIAYHDTTTGNAGGVYRDNSVDIQSTSDTGGGYQIAYVKAGEWLKYTVKVTATGTYAIDFRVSQKGSGGRFHLEVDGVDKTGSMTAPDTGSWQTWKTVTKTGVSLTSGTHVMRLVMDADGSSGYVANFNWFAARADSTSSASAATPYLGAPVSLPGTFEAENYDVGGEGVAYHDTTSGNAGGVYRQNNVDIQATSDTGGGFQVAYVKAGEWLQYLVEVASSGTYAIEARVAQRGSGGSFHVEVDGVDETGPLTVPDTGGWDVWDTISSAGVALASGVHAIRIVMDAEASSGYVANFNWFAVR